MTACTFHPERETGRACTRCGRPACPDCLAPAPVGSHCPECAPPRPSAPSAAAARFGRTDAGLPAHRSSPAAPARPLAEVVRPAPVFVALLLVTVAAGWWAWRGESGARAALFVFVVAGWVVSLCLHEFAHAVAAYLGGDRSVVGKGYLTLDPLRYAEPGMSLVLPLVFLVLGGIGLPGGAVWIDRGAIRSRHWRSAMSLAGPVTNLVLAAVLLSPFALGWLDLGRSVEHPYLASGLAFLGLLQVVAAVLNLLPIPGLDGFATLEPYLPERFLEGIAPYRAYSTLLLFLLVFQVPAFNRFLWDSGFDALQAFDVPQGLAALGYELFRFWG